MLRSRAEFPSKLWQIGKPNSGARAKTSSSGLINSILRRIVEYMYTRILEPPTSSFFLFGARGTGKSTWLREHFAESMWFNLLDEALYQRLLVAPGEFSNRLRTLKAGDWVVVDEVQRLPNLLNEVHRGIEEWGLRFALTGSSARKLKRAGVNLLAGRARRRAMLPLLPQELGSDFNAESVLRFGTVPLVWSAEERGETLRDYVQTYLKEEIQAEALVRNLAGFARTLPVMALFNAQVTNVAAIARDAEVERKTAEGYLQILEDTLLARRLYPYQAKIMVRERKKPKLYWVDPGIVRAAKGLVGSLALEERGPLFESYVFQIIRHAIENERRYNDVFYWASTEGKTEVDFLLQQDDAFVAVEAKATTRVRPEHLKGLAAIDTLANVIRKVVVYAGTDYQMTANGTEIVPVEQFAARVLA